MFLAGESLFSWVSIEEGFPASLGMTANAIFSATCVVCRDFARRKVTSLPPVN